MLYCVFFEKEIIGRFLRKGDAINYFFGCWMNGRKNVTMRSMTKEEYQNYMKNLLTNET